MIEMYSLLIAYIALGLLKARRFGAPVSWQVAGCVLFFLCLSKFHLAHCGYGTTRTNTQSALLILSGVCVAAGQFLPSWNNRHRLLEICAVVFYGLAFVLLGVDFLTLLVSLIVGRELYSVFARYSLYGSVLGDEKVERVFYRAVFALCVFFAWITFGANLRFDFYDLIRL
jgi:hypothetical protein